MLPHCILGWKNKDLNIDIIWCLWSFEFSFICVYKFTLCPVWCQDNYFDSDTITFFLITTLFFFFNHFIHFTRLRLCQRHVNRWQTGRETFWINTKNKQKKLKWYCHDVKNKRGCSSNPRVFVFLMARPQRSSPLQLRPCWYYWSKAIQTHMMPSGMNVNNRINIVLLHVNMFCSFV